MGRLKRRLIFLITVLTLTMASSVYADEESAYAEIARLRTYTGGADEDDLKVQPVLNQTKDQKKKQVVQEEPNDGF